MLFIPEFSAAIAPVFSVTQWFNYFILPINISYYQF